MSTHPAKPVQAVQLLLAEDPQVQQAAQERILEEQRNLIAQLSAIISDPDNHAHRSNAVAKAMAILGESRSRVGQGFGNLHRVSLCATIPMLANIPTQHSGWESFNKTIEQLLPAVPALISIGEPCVDEVIKKLATTDDGVYEAKACEAVLKKLSQRPSVRSKLERALEHNKTPKRRHLEKALKSLDEKVVPTEK